MARGYHEYKNVWEDPVHGEELNCTRDIGNSHDPMAVAILKEIDGATVTVGHVPRRISALCSVFIRRGGTIRCIVNFEEEVQYDALLISLKNNEEHRLRHVRKLADLF